MNNVKPGQRVICVSTPCIPASHELAKLLVRNVGAIGTVESLDHISGFVGTVWQVKCESTWWALGPDGYVRQVMPGQSVTIGDYYLRPLLWTDEEDETLGIAGYPPSIAMDKDPASFEKWTDETLDKIARGVLGDGYTGRDLLGGEAKPIDQWAEQYKRRSYFSGGYVNPRKGNPPASDPFR